MDNYLVMKTVEKGVITCILVCWC